MVEENSRQNDQQNTETHSKAVVHPTDVSPVIPAQQSVISPKQARSNTAEQNSSNQIAKAIEALDSVEEPIGVFERRMLRATWCGIGLALITGVIFFLQFREMQKQSKILNDQASQAAKDTLTAQGQTADQIQIAKEQFRLDQRPIVWMSNVQNNIIVEIVALPDGRKQIVVTVHYTNFGKSPALKLFHSHVMAIGNKASEKIRPGPLGQMMGLLPPNKDDFFSAVSNPIETKDIPNILKDLHLAAWARFRYQDSIGNIYESDLCMARLQSNAWTFCVQGNAIKDCSKETCEP